MRSLGIARFLVVGAALCALAAAAVSQASASTSSCGSLRVDFKPEGSGGAMSIRARGIACAPARRVIARCVRGTVTTGWTVVTDTQTLMTMGLQRITYTPVGGGGCGAFTKNCADFSYRGVGFFSMHVLGPNCSGGRALARSWYGSRGRCSFAHACEVAGYHCVPRAGSATVTCRHSADGYRVDWQMGE
jgi:hypothetical protein